MWQYPVPTATLNVILRQKVWMVTSGKVQRGLIKLPRNGRHLFHRRPFRTTKMRINRSLWGIWGRRVNRKISGWSWRRTQFSFQKGLATKEFERNLRRTDMDKRKLDLEEKRVTLEQDRVTLEQRAQAECWGAQNFGIVDGFPRQRKWLDKNRQKIPS